MKVFFTSFLLIFLFQSLSAQDQAPASTVLSACLEKFSAQFTALASDSTVTFEQVQPLFAALFAQYQHKQRRERAESPQTHYLFVVTLDGFRWQEVFGGADSLLLFDPQYIRDTAAYGRTYWAATPAQRRSTLMPFLWSKMASEGQIYGNRSYGNQVNVANGMWFSYPGYNEIFTGRPDDARIFSNAKLPNPNQNILEFLNRQKSFKNRVVAFTSWDAFPAILNEKRSKILVNSGAENRRAHEAVEGMAADLNETLAEESRDQFTWSAAKQYLRYRHPRVVFLGFGDTDEAAHAGHYDRYLDAARQTDAWLAELWQQLQKDRKYRGRTTLLITSDHGRGDKVKKQWRDHHARIEGSDAIWLAVIGPDTPALGEVQQPMQLYQKQLAQTMTQLLGFTFRPGHEVAPRIETIFKKQFCSPAPIVIR